MHEIEKQLAKIPDKTYYRIGEVAKHTKVKPYVLRFWETEFKVMTPPKSRSKQRMYRRQDIETILQIKHLLYKERFTIEGARKRIAAMQRGEPETTPDGRTHVPGALAKLRRELEKVDQLLTRA